MSKATQLLEFLAEKKDFVKINDFLKSLYPVPKGLEEPEGGKQGASKELKKMLSDLQDSGKITVLNNQHLRLGKFHYPDHVTAKTEYYNIYNIVLEAKI